MKYQFDDEDEIKSEDEFAPEPMQVNGTGGKSDDEDSFKMSGPDSDSDVETKKKKPAAK